MYIRIESVRYDAHTIDVRQEKFSTALIKCSDVVMTKKVMHIQV